MIRFGRVLLIPAGEIVPAGRRLAAEGDRLELGGCSVPAGDAQLVETDACGLYLRVSRPTTLEGDGRPALAVEPGVYQLVRERA